MAYIRKRKGKFTVAVRRKHGQRLYRTFDLKSDAQCFAKETELQIQQNRFRDISEASKTTLKLVLHRYLREIIKNKADKKRERSKYNVILRHGVCNKILTELRTSDFAKYRDERAEQGISNSTINRELSALRVAIQISIDEWDWFDAYAVNLFLHPYLLDLPFVALSLDAIKAHRDELDAVS